MATKEQLEQKCREFGELEDLALIYDMARELVKKGDRLTGSALLLSSWNAERYRSANKAVLAVELGKALAESERSFCRLGLARFETVDLDVYGKDIMGVYARFSKVHGVEYTGASKVMSLQNPALFLMWDSYIRKAHHAGTSPQAYMRFMEEMRGIFGGIGWQDGTPLAKAVYEYNYMTISFPAIQEARERRERKA
jgi:hypothetical protein